MPTILVVDDHAENRVSLKRLLEHRGFAVITAEDGLQGIEVAGAERPDLVLMDVNMPKLDGWESTRRIHKLDGLTALPVIALTAYAEKRDRETAIECGCVDFHIKPVDFERLVEQIEDALRGLLN
ncbi:MAG: response regulator [Pirellulales bacterium]